MAKKIFLVAHQFRKTIFGSKMMLLPALLIMALLIYAAFTGWKNFRQHNEVSSRYQQQAQQDWLSNPDKHPHRMAHYGHFAFRPKQALSVFDFGMESYFGNSIYLEAHVQNATNFSEAGFSSGMLRFGEISIAMVLQVLFPLLVIFIGFGSIATERENGTLKILFAQGMSWKQLLLGKMLGLISAVMIIFIPTFLFIILLWVILQDAQVNAGEFLRLFLLVVSYLIYLSVFCVIVVLISALSRTSKTALTTLIGLWLLLTIVLPRASQSLGAYLYEIPSKASFAAAIEKDIMKEGDSHNPDDPHYKSLKDSLLAAHKVDSVQQLPFNYSGFVMREGERISAEIYNRHTKGLQRIYEKQNQFSKLIAFIDPYMGIKNLSMALSNTDYTSYATFQQQAEAYRYNLSQTMNELQMKYISNEVLVSTEKPVTIDSKHWASIPPFIYKAPALGTVLKTEWISILSLASWVIILAFFLGRLTKTLQVI